MVQRGSAVASGVVNGALAVAVLQAALGDNDGGGARSWVGKVLEQPFGAVLLGLVGAGVVAAGVVQFHQAYSKRFLEDFRYGAMSPPERRWITRAGQVGYCARGAVFPIVGWGLLRAALSQDPGETRDTREALIEIARARVTGSCSSASSREIARVRVVHGGERSLSRDPYLKTIRSRICSPPLHQ